MTGRPPRPTIVNVDDKELANFLRGLTIGALLGAIIAGSRIWRALGKRNRP
jgi:hypothetical protein